ncbi:MAG TPA: DUF202 domain-containing protein [Methylibium sp.]|uniref:YidH family protein n=1 Tax=Methylibium sp. TaxID=2067992 RepID=UPI002DBAEB1F|nr:DUF202 domain-containing protein [Methylibium sp.]HEU4459657.1 DUF202 domain-containing protein [Methylibium sp.]
MREPAWRREGEEPDYRFSLANERTFLAWIRTALGVLATGLLLDQFATRLEPQRVVAIVALLLCAAAGLLSALAYRRWRDNEIAMRLRERLPPSSALFLMAASLVAVATALAVLMLLRLAGPA